MVPGSRPSGPRLRGVLTRLAVRARTSDETTLMLLLGAVSVTLATLTVGLGANAVPVATQTIPLAAGGVRLGLSRQRLLVAVAAGGVLAVVLSKGLGEVRLGAVVVVALMAVGTLALAGGRQALGVSGTQSESMLLELQERLRSQGELPRLPAGWAAEVVLRPADGAGFAGDFNVSTLRDGGRRLEVAVVDVSGKGVAAGTRALLLSGALGGLLGAVDRARFLPDSSAYLVGQDWDEGFATAVHVSLDLVTGAYEVRSAGHPPVAHFDAGSGRWQVSGAEGPALGLVDGAEYPVERGLLRPGDALILYTDGLVEVPGQDLSVGIDKLLGEAERLVRDGFAGGAARLVEKVGADRSDDRALLLLWRKG